MSTAIFDSLRRRNAEDLHAALQRHDTSSLSSPEAENTDPEKSSSSSSDNKWPTFTLNRKAVCLGNDALGRSPLFRAVESGYLDLVRPLLDHYKSYAPPLPPPIPITPTTARDKLNSYNKSRRLPSVEVISAAAAEKTESDAEDTYRQHVEAERAELARVCQIDDALLCAANVNGNADLVELLLLECKRVGGNVNARDELTKQSVLHGCCARGLVRSVTLLIRHLATLNPRDSEGRVPLHYAAAAFSPARPPPYAASPHEADAFKKRQHKNRCREADQIVYLLIVNRCEINVRDKDGMTPFSVALAHRNLAVANTLIDHDCEADTHCAALGMTPLMECVRSGFVEGWKLLLPIRDAEIHDGMEAPTGEEECYSRGGHDESHVKVFVNAVNKAGVSALEFAVLGGHAAAVRRLLHCGADPMRCVHPTTGDTLAMTCVRLGHYSCLKRLCQPVPVWRRRRRRPRRQSTVVEQEQEKEDKKDEPEEQQQQQPPAQEEQQQKQPEELQPDAEQKQSDIAADKDGISDDDDYDDDAPRKFAQVGSLTFDRPRTPTPPPGSPLSPTSPQHVLFEAAEDGFNNSKFPWIKCSNVLAKNNVGETALDLALARYGDATEADQEEQEQEDEFSKAGRKIVVYLKKLQPRPKRRVQKSNKNTKQYANEFEKQLLEAHGGLSADEEEEEDDEDLAEFLEEKRRREEPPIVFSSDDEEEEVVAADEEEEEDDVY